MLLRKLKYGPYSQASVVLNLRGRMTIAEDLGYVILKAGELAASLLVAWC